MFFINVIYSQPPIPPLVHHTTNWFGPNANPVPEFTNATIPEKTIFTVFGDYYYGYGDKTQSITAKIEVPLISNKVSVKAWIVPFEKYNVTDEVFKRRNMLVEKSGTASGDLYVQTRVSLISEKKYRPAIIFNATLKTASGSNFKDRRFFNTAGYYFDTEIGKSLHVNNPILKEIRLVGNLGFFSWDVQTPGLNVQDDAIMYGAKLILRNDKVGWENTYSGYSGWLRRVPDYGDKPVVFASKLNYYDKNFTAFVQYQHGIRYFPFDQIRVGADIPLAFLTPHFSK
ncbi:hypothetical protein [Epilithonimonas sp. UC225_85]|uniref:hypothetical protein n=1 Tax=Epilithonimonas sp. UC225_85 TaxID=3350167 RepID=UPI0036D42641